MTNTTRIADLTVDELMLRLREELRPLVREAVEEAVDAALALIPPSLPPLDDFPIDDPGPWPEGLTLRREEMCDNDGR